MEEVKAEINRLISRRAAPGLRATTRDAAVSAMRNYLERCDVSIDALPPVVHVAGTKGKGSTCAFTESMLRAHGLRTGAWRALAAPSTTRA